MDVAVLLRKNVYKPLEEVAIHKQTQTHKLTGYRDQLEETMDTAEHDLQVVCGRGVLLCVCVLGGGGVISPLEAVLNLTLRIQD